MKLNFYSLGVALILCFFCLSFGVWHESGPLYAQNNTTLYLPLVIRAAPAAVSSDTVEASLVFQAAGVQPNYDQLMTTELAWIAAGQFNAPALAVDGAIPEHRETTMPSHVSPYVANYAATALLEQPKLYAPQVRRYLDWYFRHLNWPDYQPSTPPCGKLYGSVYDYLVEPNGVEHPLMQGGHPFYDSTDAYAATFLLLLKKYYEKTGDKTYLLTHNYQVRVIAGVMICTQRPDGLTWATPDYRVKYLMDNAEVFGGFQALVWLAQNVFQDQSLATYYTNAANAVKNGLETKLWNASANNYRFAVDESGATPAPQPANWKIFTPDATAQLFPLFMGVLAPSNARAVALYRQFNLSHPQWPALTDPGQDFPYAMLAYQAALMGDKARVNQFLDNVKRKYSDVDHPWPWHSGEAGFVVLAAQKAKTIP
ncbi:MAG: hypothetical protein U0350_37825 [Caldilineaceae bacterium]